MSGKESNHAPRDPAKEVLGYLSFSIGSPDPSFLRSLDDLYWERPEATYDTLGAWKAVQDLLTARRQELAAEGGAFATTRQAEEVLSLIFEALLPAYREFHADLLFHQSAARLFTPFFVGRVAEAALAAGPPWDERGRIVPVVIEKLNDFIGYRPIAVLENGRQCLPYEHERVRPIPLYVQHAGVGGGPYHDVVSGALDVLRQTDEGLMRAAFFQLDALEELALDPRAYDFEHPANRRPNYHFGEWDPLQINGKGRYTRFVLRQPTLDALMSRVESGEQDQREEMLFESSAVLAGVILMASGISGDGPGCHDSSVSLATLMPHIAAYRDAFYQRLLKRAQGPRGVRLRAEAEERKQPFAGARQHLNGELAKQKNLRHLYVELAKVFARLGDSERAVELADHVDAPSARFGCRITIELFEARQSLRRIRPDPAAARLESAVELVRRGIECGALVDPWNFLGFQAQFPVFEAIENSVVDQRAEELLELMTQIFDLYERTLASAATAGHEELQQGVARRLQELADWWDQFATTEIEAVSGISGQAARISGAVVAQAMHAWHEAGAASGDVAFWRPIVSTFDTPKSYALVLETLLAKEDYSAAMGLFMEWLGRADEISLEERDHSFHELMRRWFKGVLAERASESENMQAWRQAKKFLDYLEANAGEFWNVPDYALGKDGGAASHRGRELFETAEDFDADEEDDVVSAAYEGVVYRDTSGDGNDADIIDFGNDPADYELDREARRVSDRLRFHLMLARLWMFLLARRLGRDGPIGSEDRELFARIAEQAAANEADLISLMKRIHGLAHADTEDSWRSTIDLDRRRALREVLQERVSVTAAEVGLARLLASSLAHDGQKYSEPPPLEDALTQLFSRLIRNPEARDPASFHDVLAALESRPVLYLSLNRGGDPSEVLSTRSLQRVLRLLAAWLPRQAWLSETWELVRRVQSLERRSGGGPGAVTEFDRLFSTAAEGIFESVTWAHRHESSDELLESLERWNELLLTAWLSHSRTLRLSAVEHLGDSTGWPELVEFIQRYGRDLFTQDFLHLGHLRSIRHLGVKQWLRRLMERPEAEDFALVRDLGSTVSWGDAERHLETIMDVVVDNYDYYRDYNSTTTQSDRGDLLYVFIDLLRVVAQYDRIEWNLRPVLLAHEALLRSGRAEAAERWRRTVAERTADAANVQLQKYDAVCQKYGLRLTSVHMRLSERFVRPLEIARLKTLVPPSLAEGRGGTRGPALESLYAEVEGLFNEPTAAGSDSPSWLTALQDEVQRAESPPLFDDELLVHLAPPRPAQATVEEINQQLKLCLETSA